MFGQGAQGVKDADALRGKPLSRRRPAQDGTGRRFQRIGRTDGRILVQGERNAAFERRSRGGDALGALSSQIFQVDPFVEAGRVMAGFMADVREETGFEMTDLNLGGGFGIRYTDEDEPVPFENYMEPVSRAVRETAAARGLAQPFVMIEPGRSIVGEAGTTLYTVGSVKEIPGVRTYVAVDGGMGDNPRYILYQSKYDMLMACRAEEEPDGLYTVAGKCCESGDLLGENVPLAAPKQGELMAVLSTGAYNYSMASRYNRRGIPPVVMVRDGKSRLIVRGETLEDLVRNDI